MMTQLNHPTELNDFWRSLLRLRQCSRHSLIGRMLTAPFMPLVLRQ